MAEILSENKQEKVPAVRRIYMGICLFPILLGAFLCMKKFLDMEITTGILVLTAGLLSLCLEILYLGKKQKAVVSLLFFLGLAAVTICNHSVLLEGGKELSNRLLEQINQYQRTDFLLWFVEEKDAGTEQVFLLLCVCFGFLETLLVSCARGKKSRNIAVLSLPLLAAGAGLLMGKVPSSEGILLILAGFLALQLKPEKKGMLPLEIGMIFIIGIATIFSSSPIAEQIFDRYHDPWLEHQLRLENRMLEGIRQIGNGTLFFGRRAQSEFALSNEGPVQTGAEIFRITVDRLPEEPVYIRGFIGGDYSGESWEKVSRQEFSNWAGSLKLSIQDCQSEVQNFTYEQLKKLSGTENGPKVQKVTIEVEQPTEGYTLSPYYTRISEKQHVEGDGPLAPQKQAEFQWESFLSIKSWQREAAAAMAQGGSSGRIWTAYESYVQEKYTRLPKQGMEKLRELAKEMGRQAFSVLYMEFDAYETAVSEGNFSEEPLGVAWQIRSRMWQDTSYSQKLEPVPEGKDFAEYFLLEQKKGYCVHYATAGTLLLRMCGIPARYVSGYIVFPEDFKKNKDGTDTWTAVVTDRRGHAWTELFQKGLGFLPVEMTPSDYTSLMAEVKTEEDMENALQQLDRQAEFRRNQEEKQQEKPEIPEEQPVQNQQQEDQRREKSEHEPDDDMGNFGNVKKAGVKNVEKRKAVIVTAACLIGTGVLFFLLWYFRKRRQRKRQAAFFQKNRTRGVLAMGKAMKPLLKRLGLEQKRGQGDQEYAAFLEEKLPGMNWERNMMLLQKAAFSQNGITEEEFQSVVELYQKLFRQTLYGAWSNLKKAEK